MRIMITNRIMTEEIKKKITGRQTANLQILDMLKNYFLAYPDMRFGQALANLNVIEYDRSKLTPEVVDPFYDESVDILQRVSDTVERKNKQF